MKRRALASRALNFATLVLIFCMAGPSAEAAPRPAYVDEDADNLRVTEERSKFKGVPPLVAAGLSFVLPVVATATVFSPLNHGAIPASAAAAAGHFSSGKQSRGLWFVVGGPVFVLGGGLTGLIVNQRLNPAPDFAGNQALMEEGLLIGELAALLIWSGIAAVDAWHQAQPPRPEEGTPQPGG